MNGVLEVQGICKAYHGRQVLSPVSFRLEPGECLGVSGVNGSGKSTLLRLLAQAQRPDGGRVLFQGRDVRGDRTFLRRRLGYVPQDNELAEELTAAQQIGLWLAACGCKRPLPEEVQALLGLEELLPRRIRELSGGMQRRVSIAMALATGPDILIMDEATTGLDETYRWALLAWLETFLQKGGSAVWCSHRQEELERVCGRCLQLQDGRPSWGMAAGE